MATLFVGIILVILFAAIIWFSLSRAFGWIGKKVIKLSSPFTNNKTKEEKGDINNVG